MMTRLGGRSVLFVMAAEAEYGPHLQARFKPLMTGIGPVEAGIALGSFLVAAAMRRELPELIVSLGSAGSRNLEQTIIYQATQLSYRDMDATAIGFAKGVTPFLDQPALIDMDYRIAGVPEATLSTGANIVSGADYDSVAADMVDMETFALHRATQMFNVPHIALRGISDGREDIRQVSDWTHFLPVIDQKLAETVDQLENALESGQLAL